jgi:hypothetical protein
MERKKGAIRRCRDYGCPFTGSLTMNCLRFLPRWWSTAGKGAAADHHLSRHLCSGHFLPLGLATMMEEPRGLGAEAATARMEGPPRVRA